MVDRWLSYVSSVWIIENDHWILVDRLRKKMFDGMKHVQQSREITLGQSDDRRLKRPFSFFIRSGRRSSSHEKSQDTPHHSDDHQIRACFHFHSLALTNTIGENGIIHSLFFRCLAAVRWFMKEHNECLRHSFESTRSNSPILDDCTQQNKYDQHSSDFPVQQPRHWVQSDSNEQSTIVLVLIRCSSPNEEEEPP